MLAARLCRVGISPAAVSLLKATITPKPALARIQVSRLFASYGRGAFPKTTRERVALTRQGIAPPGHAVVNIGKGILAGAAVCGLGALCYYGAGLSDELGAIDYSGMWPQYVKDRIKSTYFYFGASMVVTIASAAMCLRSAPIMRLVSRNGILTLIGTLAALVASGAVVHNLPYKEGFTAKHVAWLVYAGIMGAVLAPSYTVGGMLVLRAALYTAGVTLGLSTIAICAPNEKFLNMYGPLAMFMGIVFAATFGSMVLPPYTHLKATAHYTSLYGGLLLFAILLMYDTQKIIKTAVEHFDHYGDEMKPYDPINNAITIYLDVLNIFVRLAVMLCGDKK